MRTTMTAAAAVGLLPTAAVAAGSERGGGMQRQRLWFIGGRLPQHCGKIRALAISVYSPSARSAGTQQEVHSSTSSALRVASMFKAVMQQEGDVPLPTSALAIAASAASVSSTPLGFINKIGDPGRLLSSPSAEFLALCAEQLSLCEKIVGHQTNLTVRALTRLDYFPKFGACSGFEQEGMPFPTVPEIVISKIGRMELNVNLLYSHGLN